RTQQVTEQNRRNVEGKRSADVPQLHRCEPPQPRSNTVAPLTQVRKTLPSNLRPSKGEFLERDERSSRSQAQGAAGSKRTRSAGASALSRPCGRPSRSAGPQVTGFIAASRETSSRATRLSSAGSRVSRPTAPKAASARGSRLSS